MKNENIRGFFSTRSPSCSLKDQYPEGEYLAERFTNDGLSKRNQPIGCLEN